MRASTHVSSLLPIVCSIQFTLAVALAGCSVFSSSAVAAEKSVMAPENVITNPAAHPDWSELFAELGRPTNRHSRFEERRHFPFRDKPVVLQGEIRIVPKRGLSLSYSGAKPHVVIIDDQGVLMRDERGRQRSAPDDSRARAVTSALSHVLRFNLPVLEKEFVIHGLREGESWTLGFVPRETALTNSLGTITVHGRQNNLVRIEMARSDQQRVEIVIKDSQSDVIFAMDVLQRFFR